MDIKQLEAEWRHKGLLTLGKRWYPRDGSGNERYYVNWQKLVGLTPSNYPQGKAYYASNGRAYTKDIPEPYASRVKRKMEADLDDYVAKKRHARAEKEQSFAYSKYKLQKRKNKKAQYRIVT